MNRRELHLRILEGDTESMVLTKGLRFASEKPLFSRYLRTPNTGFILIMCASVHSSGKMFCVLPGFGEPAAVGLLLVPSTIN